MAPFNLHHVIFNPGMIIPMDYVENMEIFKRELKLEFPDLPNPESPNLHIKHQNLFWRRG